MKRFESNFAPNLTARLGAARHQQRGYQVALGSACHQKGGYRVALGEVVYLLEHSVAYLLEHSVAALRRRTVSLMRANPATSAPSHICETWRNVAQTCLDIKEMGPERSRINVCNPIVASF